MATGNEIKINNIPIVREFLEDKNRVDNLRQQSAEKKIPVITMETGAVLEAICFAYRPVNILEIGCGTGFSTYFIIRHFLYLKKGSLAQSAANPSDGILRYTGIDLNRQRLAEARDYITGLFSGFAIENNEISLEIDFICGNALKIIPGLNSGFDMVFIDAAKMEYPFYLDALEPKIANACIVVADNIFYSRKVFDDFTSEHDKNSVSGIRQYIKKIADSNYFSTAFINVGDGIAISVYKKNP